MTGIIVKKLKEHIDLKYSFFQIKTNKNTNFDIITNDLINCNNIEKNKSDSRFEIKEYKSIDLKSLNINIFQNLSKENQRLIVKNNNQKFLILLCEINYNKKMAEDKIIENKIKKIANQIEIEFVKTKKKEFKFQIFN